MTTNRRPANDRILGALWGSVVAGTGILLVLTFSGYVIDIELVSIVALVVIGGWLALSAVLSGRSRDRIAATPASFAEGETHTTASKAPEDKKDTTPTR